MIKFILSALFVFCLTTSPRLPHKEVPHIGNYTDYHRFKDYHLKNGVHKLNVGYCFIGRNHSHWDYQKWSFEHGSWLFYYNELQTWYYFCPPHNVYYPIAHTPFRNWYFEGDPFSTQPQE